MKFYLILILAFVSLPIFGQTVDFSLDVNGQYIRPSSYQIESELDVITYRFLRADSLVKRTFSNRLRTEIQEYTPIAGVDVNWYTHIGIGDKLNLKTGIGFNYVRYETNSVVSSGYSNEEITGVDTIDASRYNTFSNQITIPASSSYAASNRCDILIESSVSSRDLKDGFTNHVLSLRIPLEVEYELLQDKFFVGVGAYFQTPIYTEIQRESIRTNRTMVDEGIACESEEVVLRNKSGDGFNNSQIGVMGNFTYRFFRNLGLKFKVSKDLNNFYSKYQASDGSLVNVHNFRPMRFSLGLDYKFGGKLKRGKVK